MAAAPLDRPAIHICSVGAIPDDLALWVEIGAEEEGVPARIIEAQSQTDLVASAYAASRSSRVDIGVALSTDQVVLHESHMPENKPVLSFNLGIDPRKICRLMGGNAARMVARLPLKFEEDLQELPESSPILPKKREVFQNQQASFEKINHSEANSFNVEDVKRIAALVASIVRERGKTWP